MINKSNDKTQNMRELLVRGIIELRLVNTACRTPSLYCHREIMLDTGSDTRNKLGVGESQVSMTGESVVRLDLGVKE